MLRLATFPGYAERENHRKQTERGPDLNFDRRKLIADDFGKHRPDAPTEERDERPDQPARHHNSRCSRVRSCARWAGSSDRSSSNFSGAKELSIARARPSLADCCAFKIISRT